MIRVGIYGATGYTGQELVEILLGHPQAELGFLTSETYRGKKYSEVLPCACEMPLAGAAEADVSSVEAVFVCLPHTTAMEKIAEIYGPGLKIIDLSADFRFGSPDEYARWYGVEHKAPELIGHSVYGLPELFRERIPGAGIVGNPGCYPTGAILALAPAASAGLLGGDARVIIDAKSGVSGAGRKADLMYNFVEVSEDIRPYKIGRAHRHVGEMESVLGSLAGNAVGVVFTPQLAPFSRGILYTIYLDSGGADLARVRRLYERAYAEEPFVCLLPPEEPARLAYVRGNNACVIGLHRVEGSKTVVITAAIDNLVKGASGQAVQNFNLLFGLPETTGLSSVPGRLVR
ncbi:MAG: N-acetyl-gamma-glutamyl-phosphate reductase [Candidatus Glassbacteria bacterium]|nr:N-acetyl-gamma-glutamyl-phosphate reductase [Candidatus Glassbacteria bacterium]